MVSIQWNEFYAQIKPLVLFIIGMTIYAIFIFKFYRFLARREIFKLDLQKYTGKKMGGLKKFFSSIMYVFKYLLMFPMFVFFWFGMISVLLMVMAKNQTANQILLIAMALVATVRVTAYYHEDLSKDLAKMLPFALLGVFLIDVSYFTYAQSLELVKQIPGMYMTLAYYLVFVIALEFVLRIISFILPRREENSEE